jgi:hypothetical protein
LCGCETWSLTLKEEHRLRVFENRVLGRGFGPKRDKVTRGWRKVYDELHNLSCSPNNIRMIKSRRTRQARHQDSTGTWKICTKFLQKNLKGRHCSGDLVTHERIILKWFLWKQGGCGDWCVYLRIGISGGLLWTW